MIRTFLKAISQPTDLKNLLRNFSKHLDLTCLALDKLAALVDTEDTSKITILVEEIRRLEREGDELIRILTIETLRLVLPPQQLQILAILLDKLDDMLDNVTLSGNELCRYILKIRQKYIWGTVKHFIREMILRAREAASTVSSLLREGKFENINEVLTLVSLIEQDVDNIKNKILDELSLHAEHLTCAELLSLRNIVLNVDEVADLTRDIATLVLVLRALCEI